MIKNFIKLLTFILPVMLLAQSPGGVGSNMTVWFRADAGTTGSPVQTWTNQASNATLTSITQGTAGNRATLNPGGYNFNPTLSFNGSNYYSSANSFARTAFVNTNRYNFFVVSRQKATGSMMLFSHWTSNSDRFTFEPNGVFHNAASSFFSYVGLGQPSLAESSFTGSALNWGSNGLLGSNAFSTILANGSTPFRIGTQTGSNLPWNGDIAEIIIYNEANLVTDHARIRSYLALKYGITLENQSYIASDGTTKMWDNTKPNAATYNKNIAGIGRDNNSASLNQKQSQSQNPGIQPVIAAGNIAVANANNTSTLTNMEFLSWGDNNGARSFDTSVASPGDIANRRFSAIWKVQKTAGFSNTVTVGIPVTSASPVYLVRSTNDTFDASDTWIQLSQTTVNGVQYWATPSQITLSDGEYFTFAKYVTAPGGVMDDIALWYKADAGVTGGTNITGWANQVGGYNLAYASGAYNTYNTAANLLNFNPSVTTGGAAYTALQSAYMPPVGVTASQSGSDYVTSHFTVFSTANTTANNSIWRHNKTSGTPDTHSVSQEVSGRALITNRFSIPANPIANQTMLYSFVGNSAGANAGGATGKVGRNGVTGSANWDTTLASPAADDPSTRFSVGGIAANTGEVIVYKTAKTAQQRQRIESYLAIKYGITLNDGGTNYLNGASSEVWNVTTNAGYNNNIFGIGRDDLSALYQKQSKSVNEDQKLIIGAGNSLANTNAANTNALTDGQFLLVGNNGSKQALSVSLAYTGGTNGEANYRFGSIWKVQNTNNVGQVTLAWPKGVKNLYAVQSSTAVFNAASTFTPMTTEVTINGVEYNTATVTLSNGEYFTFAGYAHAPGGVMDDIALWYKADAGVTGGTNITGWANQVGGYNLAYASGAYNTYNTAANLLNFNPSVTTGGAAYTALQSAYMPPVGVTASQSGSDYVTSHFTVFSTANTTANNSIWRHNKTSGTPDTHSVSQEVSGRALITNRFSIPANPIANQTMLYSFVGNSAGANAGGATGKVGRNGVTGSANWDTTLASPAADDPSTRFSVGGIAANTGEVIVYKTAKTAQQRQRIESYLAIKYGITLNDGGTNYLNGASSEVWNVTTNAGYNNNIFGIGRDDLSILNQKVSRSVNAGSILTVATSNDFTSSNLDAARTDLANDQTFFLLGDNNVSATPLTNMNISGKTYNRIQRIWKAQETNEAGNLFFQADLTAYTITGRAVMLVSDDAAFTSPVVVSPTSSNGSKWIFEQNVANGKFITFANDPCYGVDTDSDGVPDMCDLDNDNDGILDANECGSTEKIAGGVFPTTGGNTNTVPAWTVGGTYAASGAWTSATGKVNLNTNGLEFRRDNSTVTTISQDLTGIFSYAPVAINLNSLYWFKSAYGNNADTASVLTISYAGTIYATISTTAGDTPTVTASNGASVNVAALPTVTTNSTRSANTNLIITLPVGVPSTGQLLFTFTAGNSDGARDIGLASVSILACVDTDNDGILDYLDLDSDNDGCLDAIEGDENVTAAMLVNAANGLEVGSGSSAANQNLCASNSCVDANGVPLVVNGGQGVGDSNNSLVKSCPLSCTKPATIGTPLTSSVGILTKGALSVTGWPKSVPNGYLVLDGAFKGMVITHMTTAQINALVPVEGMLVFDTDESCVKLYRGTSTTVEPGRTGWVCIERICID